MKPIALTKEVKKLLKPALWGNAQKQIFGEVQRGRSALLATDDNQMVAVLRLEGREMVVVALAGRNLRAHRQEIIDYALSMQALTIRFHTKNPQHLAKGVAGLQVELAEVRKRLFGKDEHVYRLVVA